MHSVSPYTLRCFNPAKLGKTHNDKYCDLDKIGASDLYEILKNFITANSSQYINRDHEKEVYKFSAPYFDDKKREIYALFGTGIYGAKSSIIDVKTQGIVYDKKTTNAEIINYHVHFFIPKNVNEGIALFHSYRGNGVKTIFYDIFKEHFSKTTSLNIQMNPLAYEKAMQEWSNANAKEIKLIKYNKLNDIADAVKLKGHREADLIIKPEKGTNFGKLENFFKKDSEISKSVELLTPLCAQVKTVVQLGNKKRTFTVGKAESTPVCEIDIGDEVKLIDGMPESASMVSWCRTVIGEFCQSIYPGAGVKL